MRLQQVHEEQSYSSIKFNSISNSIAASKLANNQVVSSYAVGNRQLDASASIEFSIEPRDANKIAPRHNQARNPAVD
jgi:hypothetical protein